MINHEKDGPSPVWRPDQGLAEPLSKKENDITGKFSAKNHRALGAPSTAVRAALVDRHRQGPPRRLGRCTPRRVHADQHAHRGPRRRGVHRDRRDRATQGRAGRGRRFRDHDTGSARRRAGEPPHDRADGVSGARMRAGNVRANSVDRSRPGWREFCRAQAQTMLACDLFTVESVSLRRI
jgi:hypothetical protein